MSALPAVTTTFSTLPEGFFKSVSSSVIEQLIWRYNGDRRRVEKLHDFIHSQEMSGAVNVFLRGSQKDRGDPSGSFSDLASAIKVLDADYWQQALNATDVYEHMPQKRRSEWREQIDNREVPEFETDTVINTLKKLLLERDKFLSERVDGVFKALSGEHVTNAPEGFSKRMIMYTYHSWGGINITQAGYVADLRTVIGKFMGRGPATPYSTCRLLEECQKSPGQWEEWDGGTLRVKVFKKGTAHIEVHPDIAWRLNEILAFLYPQAIPPKFRARPLRKQREISLTQNLIPHDVLDMIREIEPRALYKGEGFDCVRVGWAEGEYQVDRYYSSDKHLREKVCQILEACGGEHVEGAVFRFDYDFKDIQRHLMFTGTLPDQAAHQYYPTPVSIGKELVEWSAIEHGMSCIEPQAGQGGLAKLMPADTLCVEVSDLNCQILRNRGMAHVVHADFLEWSKGADLVDRVVMNPPFSHGRAENHLRAAGALLKKGGVLTAVVPASLQNKPEMAGFRYEWRNIDRGEFPGVSIDLAMVRMVREEYA